MPVTRHPLSPVLVACVALALPACTHGASIPDPRVAAEAYAAAAEKHDGAAIYALLTRATRATRSEQDVKDAVAAAAPELTEQAKAIRDATPAILTVARIRYDDGAEAALTLKDGAFFIASAGLLPGAGATPEEAIGGLRDALRRRSYPALLRVLTPELRAAVEAQLRGLVEALDDPATLQIPSSASQTITLRLPNGHSVTLKKEGASWYIENFQ